MNLSMPVKLSKSEVPRQFNIGCKRGLYLFATIKVPLLILSTLIKTLQNTNLLHSMVLLNPGRSLILQNVVVTPVIEEIVFRGVLQSIIKKVARVAVESCLVYQENHKESYEIKVDESVVLTAKIASSILFGVAHFPFGGVVQAFSAGLGAYYGEADLWESHGLIASISCHATNNVICHVISIIK